MDLFFSSSIRKAAVPAFALCTEVLPSSRSLESTIYIYVTKEMKNARIYQMQQFHLAKLAKDA